jgi:hypothetical protein
MANDIAYGVVLLVFVGAIVAYVYWPRPPRTIVHERTGPTTVLVEPALTPLHDSGPANNARRRTARQPNEAAPTDTRRPAASGGGVGSRTPARPPTRTGAKHPTRKHEPAASPSTPTQSSQPSQPPQATNPPPSVSVPLPSVCVPPVRVGNCP